MANGPDRVDQFRRAARAHNGPNRFAPGTSIDNFLIRKMIPDALLPEPNHSRLLCDPQQSILRYVHTTSSSLHFLLSISDDDFPMHVTLPEPPSPPAFAATGARDLHRNDCL